MMNLSRTQRAPVSARATENSTAWALAGTIAGTFTVMMATIVLVSPVSVPVGDFGTLPGGASIPAALASVAAIAALFVLTLTDRLTPSRALGSGLTLLLSLGVLLGDVLWSASDSPDAQVSTSVAAEARDTTDAAMLCAEFSPGVDAETISIVNIAVEARPFRL